MWVAAPGGSADGGRGLHDARFETVAGRLANQDELDQVVAAWCADRNRWDIETELQNAGIPAGAVRRPGERIDGDMATGARGLWPMIEHPAMGGVRVDGQPVQFSVTDWSITEGGPLLGQDNHYVIGDLLGRSAEEIQWLEDEGVI